MTPEEPEPEQPRMLIGVKTATILYTLLGAAAFATLHGKALGVALIIVVGLAAKSYLHYWGEKQMK
jgi:hypothetical protein